jgi:DNA-binding NarL/FixJ family response regulator
MLDYMRKLRPRVVILDLKFGDGGGHRIDGVDLVRPLSRLGCAVLVVSGYRDQVREAAAVAAGAAALIPKTSSLTTLLNSIHAAAAGESAMPEHIRQTWLRLHSQHQAQQREHDLRFEQLSAREREVLELLAQGHRARAIAEHFVVSMTTVRTQIAAILTKLGVSSQLEAVALVTHNHHRRSLPTETDSAA